MYFHDPRDRQSKELFPGITTRTFWGEKVLLSLVELEPNSVLPNHSHPYEQAGLVLEGELEFTIGGVTRLVKAGEVFVIPGHVEHSGRTGARLTRVMDVFSPAREDYKY